MTILYEPEISTAGHYEPEIPTAGHYEITASHYEFKNGASFREHYQQDQWDQACAPPQVLLHFRPEHWLMPIVPPDYSIVRICQCHRNGAVLEVVHTLDPIDPVDVTGIPVAQTQNSVDPDNVVFLFLLSLIKCSVPSNVTTLCLSCRTPSSFDVSTLSGSTEFCV
jgi:hypothetical protein